MGNPAGTRDSGPTGLDREPLRVTAAEHLPNPNCAASLPGTPRFDSAGRAALFAHSDVLGTSAPSFGGALSTAERNGAAQERGGAGTD